MTQEHRKSKQRYSKATPDPSSRRLSQNREGRAAAQGLRGAAEGSSPRADPGNPALYGRGARARVLPVEFQSGSNPGVTASWDAVLVKDVVATSLPGPSFRNLCQGRRSTTPTAPHGPLTCLLHVVFSTAGATPSPQLTLTSVF